jgi:predicted transcriptional regulator
MGHDATGNAALTPEACSEKIEANTAPKKKRGILMERLEMNANQFKRWQKAMGWSVTQTARNLHVHERQIYCYRSGQTPVPPAMACLCDMFDRMRQISVLLPLQATRPAA